MPKLDRAAYYDLTRDMNWHFKYVPFEAAFPAEMVYNPDVPLEEWWTWDEPYKISYREYVYNQSEKDGGVYSVKAAIARSKLFDALDNGWKSALTAHYGAIALSEYLASIGEARMARFGLGASWRNMATYGCLDETRHGQIQVYFPYELIDKHPQFDWALKALHTNEWGAIAARSIFDRMFTSNDALSTAIQLTFTFETGFTNLQFLGMAADAMDIGDVEFGALISSIQTDESRHAQIGEPTLRILVRNGKKAEAQHLVETMWWRAWHLFALLTGLSMDYYTPLEHRSMSFKEFMEEWVLKQFLDMFKDLGMDPPWYWDKMVDEMNWYHHGLHLGVWFWRPTVWWNPDGGVSEEERAWLEEKYPGWNDTFGRYWDVITENIRNGHEEKTLPQTLPMVCNMCQIPIVTLSDPQKRHNAPYVSHHDGRQYNFCSEPCKWIFDQEPEKYAGHLSIVDQVLSGHVQPPTLENILAYMGLTPEVMGRDADNYAWAYPKVVKPSAAGS